MLAVAHPTNRNSYNCKRTVSYACARTAGQPYPDTRIVHGILGAPREIEPALQNSTRNRPRMCNRFARGRTSAPRCGVPIRSGHPHFLHPILCAAMLSLLVAGSAFTAPMGASVWTSRVAASPVMMANDRKGGFWQRDDWQASSTAATAATAEILKESQPGKERQGAFWQKDTPSAAVVPASTTMERRTSERKAAFWQREDWIQASAATAAETKWTPTGQERQGAFWQRDPPAAPAVAAAAPAAAPAAAASSSSSTMTVPQACVFMEDASVAGVSFEEKKAFLMSKGVSEFVVAGAACTAPDSTLVL